MAPSAPLSLRALGRATLARQGLLKPIRSSPAEAVGRLGSLQAQHPEWPPVALAARAANGMTADLAGALSRREVVRSSLMRITIHVVAAADFWAMFTACQPIRLDQWRLIMKADPLDSPLGRAMAAAHPTAIAALRERPRSSLELDRMMSADVGPAATATARPAWRQPDTQLVVRAAWRHFAAVVPLVHVPHEREGYGRSLYALAEDWLTQENPGMALDDARAHVARRYLAAFGPATVEDLAAYVGRGRGGLARWRHAIESLGDEVVRLRDVDGRDLVDIHDGPRPPAETTAPPRLLARWDSVLLSHSARARGRIIDDVGRAAAFTKNADVRPTFLIDGMVAGTWSLARGDRSAALVLTPFRRLGATVGDELVAEAERVLAVIAPDVERSVAFEAGA